MKKTLLLFIAVLCVSAMFAQPKELKTNYFKRGKIHLVNSSHQDIAWVNAPEVCKKERAELVMLPLLERMEQNPTMCFSVESAMYLKEFLEAYPEKYDQILKYTQQGRLEWGATYSQPYQGLYDGEALLRQSYLGRKDLKKMLPGCDFKAAWNVDVPGMSPQFPQILSKSGIPYYNISRFKTGFYEWFSPDGSSVKVVSTGQYSGYSGQVLAQPTDAEKTDALINIVNYWGDYQQSRKIAPACLALLSQDCTKPVDFDSLMYKWNERKVMQEKALPVMQYSTSTTFFDHLTSNKAAKFDKVCGARPDVWLYIHGPTHHRAVSAGREASRTLVAAEKFATFASLVENDFSHYPQQRLHSAWECAIFPDHGWGGYHGVITDRLFREKFEAARDSAHVILREAVASIAHQIGYNKQHLYAITVFNALSWQRTDPVIFTLDAEGRANNYLKIVDDEGRDVPFQFVDDHKFKGNRDEVLSFAFCATDIPALGYKTYYIVESQQPTTVASPVEFPNYENQFYTLKLGKGGIESLFDKELNCEVFNTSKFKGAEIFTLKSEGTGAGEFADVQQPTMEGFDKLSNYNTPWTCVESGVVRDVFRTTAQFKDAQVNLSIVLYKSIKKIDLEVAINGYVGENWREYRMALPLTQEQRQITYDMHFGAIEVGRGEMDGMAGEKNQQPSYDVVCAGVHPREVQDWFGAFDGVNSLTVSSSVAVFDWIDPTSPAGSPYVLQPILLSSRRSCNGMGNHYLQPGNHSFTFSLYSHRGDWKSGMRSGAQPNNPLITTLVPREAMTQGGLPETLGFVSMAGEGVVVSAVKKCDDDEAVVVRCFNVGAADSQVTVKLFKALSSVEQTNLIEEGGVPVRCQEDSFTSKIGHHAIETFKLKTK